MEKGTLVQKLLHRRRHSVPPVLATLLAQRQSTKYAGVKVSLAMCSLIKRVRILREANLELRQWRGDAQRLVRGDRPLGDLTAEISKPLPFTATKRLKKRPWIIQAARRH